MQTSFPLLTLLVLAPFFCSAATTAHVCVLRDAPDLPPTALPDHRINDNYCDCADASDENGTSACPNGYFTCHNKRYRPVKIYSSWVHDGSCDCCDGSDEPAGACPDTCASLREADLKEATRKADVVRRGIATRKAYAKEMDRTMRLDRSELKKMERELARVKSQLETREKAIDLLKKRRDWEKTISVDNNSESVPTQASDSGSSSESDLDYEYGEDHIPDDSEFGDIDHQNASGLDDEEFVTTEDDEHISDDHSQREEDIVMDEAEEITTAEDEQHDIGDQQHLDEHIISATAAAAGSQQEEKIQQSEELPNTDSEQVSAPNQSEAIDVDHLCADLQTSSPNWVVRRFAYVGALVLSKVRRVLPKSLVPSTGNSSAKLDTCISNAEGEKWELESKKRDLEDKIEKLKKKSSIDYGADNALRKLHGSCTKGKVTQYEFEHCLFETVRQYENGASIAQLGRFDGWEGEGKDRFMKYVDGDRCWNGPQRSIKVQLLCGDNEEVVSVNEPNRCAYTMKFKTPAACEESMIKEIMADFESTPDEEKQEL